jgi:hypothetical protein
MNKRSVVASAISLVAIAVNIFILASRPSPKHISPDFVFDRYCELEVENEFCLNLPDVRPKELRGKLYPIGGGRVARSLRYE